MREIILDTETTGFDPSSGHRIVEIGCVEVIGKVITDNTFHRYINPEMAMPEGAFKVHGLSDEFLSDKPLFADVVDDFMAFISNDILVIHNAEFDMKFINSEITRLDIDAIPYSRAKDTLMIARKKFPKQSNSLDALCKRYDINLGDRTLHGALLDAKLLALVYIELIGGRQNKLSLVERGMEYDKKSTKILDRDFPPSQDELNIHAQFIKDYIRN